MTCPLCYNTDIDLVAEYVYKLAGRDVKVRPHECQTCGFVFLNPQPFLGNYYDSQDRVASDTVAYKEQAEWLYKAGINNAKTLDVGAYDGRLLDALVTGGVSHYKTHGIEPDDVGIVEYIRHAGFHDVNEQYELITMSHVFEHVPDFWNTLDWCRQLLAPGGHIYIEVPDLDDPQMQIVPYWTAFHNWYFNEYTLRKALRQSLFRVIKMERPGYRSIRVLARVGTKNIAPSWRGILCGEHYELCRVHRLWDMHYKIAETVAYPVVLDECLVWGAGDHTYWLAYEFPWVLDNTLAIIDSNKTGEFLGKRIISPNEAKEYAGCRVIVSSYDHQDEIAKHARDLGLEPVTLYDDVRAYDVWKGN